MGEFPVIEFREGRVLILAGEYNGAPALMLHRADKEWPVGELVDPDKLQMSDDTLLCVLRFSNVESGRSFRQELDNVIFLLSGELTLETLLAKHQAEFNRRHRQAL